MRRFLLLTLALGLFALHGAPHLPTVRATTFPSPPVSTALAIAAQPGSGRIDYFSITAGAVWHSTSDATGQPGFWEPLSGHVSALSASWSGDASRLEVIGVGLDGNMWYRIWSASTQWGPWTAAVIPPGTPLQP